MNPGLHFVSYADEFQISWLFRPEQDLNLVPTEQATINNTYIYSVETLAAPKAEVLQSIESEHQQRPSRYARVVLFEGNSSEYGMREYKVYLPIIALRYDY